MVNKNCVICGKPFQALNRKITCGTACSKKRHAQMAKLSRPSDYFKQYNLDNKDRLRVQRREYRRLNYLTSNKKCADEPVICPICGEKGMKYIHYAENVNTKHVYTMTFIRHFAAQRKIIEHRVR